MTALPTAQTDPARRDPPLRNGDRLTRPEFERRYRVTPNVNKAELIEGVVYMPSPVRFGSHSSPHWILNGVMAYYVAKTPGLPAGGDNGTVRLDNDNEPQPDLFLLLPPHLGGKAKVDEDDYISGPPALIAEIAASSTSIDLHHKKQAYARNGVGEYIVWRVEDSAVDHFLLTDRGFELQSPVEGRLQAKLFPGLWIDVAALLKGDLPALLSAVDRGVATPEHADFVSRLRAG